MRPHTIKNLPSYNRIRFVMQPVAGNERRRGITGDAA